MADTVLKEIDCVCGLLEPQPFFEETFTTEAALVEYVIVTEVVPCPVIVAFPSLVTDQT